MSHYREYGYTSTAPNHAHQYLVPVLLKMLDRDRNRYILDIGCGNGSLARVLTARGFDVYGIDASEEGISIANSLLPGRFFVQNLESGRLPEPLNSIPFDTIVSTEVIEHLYDPRTFLDLCKTILSRQPGQKHLLLSTPYHGYLKNLVLALSGAMDKHFTALWDGGHIKFWSRKTLSTLLEEKGFTVTDFRGAGRLPYLWKSMVLQSALKT